MDVSSREHEAASVTFETVFGLDSSLRAEVPGRCSGDFPSGLDKGNGSLDGGTL